MMAEDGISEEAVILSRIPRWWVASLSTRFCPAISSIPLPNSLRLSS
ncbi:hypothetical protein E2320_019512 [Naja naja]|nr:hypothetical protein E2320_019512 [Naja naja]